MDRSQRGPAGPALAGGAPMTAEESVAMLFAVSTLTGAQP